MINPNPNGSAAASSTASQADMVQPLLPHADDELRRIRQQMPQLLEFFKSKLQGGQAPGGLLRFGKPHKVARLSADEVGSIDRWFFIGDIHGDFLPCTACWSKPSAGMPMHGCCFWAIWSTAVTCLSNVCSCCLTGDNGAQAA